MIPFVHRKPEEHEVERLRQILSRYRQGDFGSLEFDLMFTYTKIIAEAFGFSLDKYHTTYIKVHENDSEYRIDISPLRRSDVAKQRKVPFGNYWKYLSKYNVDVENYRENPESVGIASVNMLYELDGNFDLTKSSFLYLALFKENRAQLSQYPYFVDPRKLHWYFDEEPTQYGTERLYGYDTDKVFEIRMSRNEILEYGNVLKGQKKTEKRKKYSFVSIEYLFSQHRMIWQSGVFQYEPLSESQIIRYQAIAEAKRQKANALAQLEGYIRTDPKEGEFQKLLSENQWMFGNEYSELLDTRELVLDSQQDFVFRRTKDDFIEVVEIKRPMKGKLFNYDKAHNSLYPGVDLSKAIGQVINYIDRIDSAHDSIWINRGIDTDKIEVKLIIGRNGDDKQVKALNNLNHHLHRIKILTYDQLLRIAKKSFVDQFGNG